MDSEKESFQKMALLTGARIFGIIFSIIIPMYLGRKLEVTTYGTYKQIMLVFWFSQVALNLGLDDSAYFYLRKNPKHFPLYSFNALLFNIFACFFLWALMIFFKIEISNLVKNPDLVQYIPLTGALVFFTVTSMQIEGILIGLNRFNERLFLEVIMELLKSLCILCGFYFFNSIYSVILAICFLMGMRLLYTIYVINDYRLKEKLYFFQSFQYFKDQLYFGLPLGLSRVLQNLLNIENFFISSYFSLVQFTYYTVGSFENPLINATRASVYELLNISLIDSENKSDHQKSKLVWKSMNRKLFLVVIPFVFYMIFFSTEIITFIFSKKYLESVPFFIVFNFYVLIGCLNPEPLFRATKNTHYILKLRVVGLILGFAMIFSGAYYSGALMALIGKTMAMFMTNFIGLYIGAKFIDASWKELFDWPEIIKISLLSLVLSMLLKWAIKDLHISTFYLLATTFSLYFFLQLLFSYYLNIIKEDEKKYLLNKFKGFIK